jgi:predicted dehydrogenase
MNAEKKQHRVLVIGGGSIGERHVRCFQSTGRALVSLVEIDEAVRRRICDRYAVAHGFASLKDALAHPQDVAVVATPAQLHVPMAQKLVDAGLHVLIEKPLSISEVGIAELHRSAGDRQCVVGVAYVYRCHPLLLSMRAAIQDGRFGRPVELVAVTGQHFPTYRPAYRDIYYRHRSTGGGAIQDALTHVINAAEWLVGPVQCLVADAAHQVLEGVEVEDTVHVLARHGHVLASYSLNQHQAPNEFTLTVVCETGTLRGEFHEHRWKWLDSPGGTWQVEGTAAIERDSLFVGQAQAFLDAVESRTPPPCSLADGWQTLRVNLAALASADERCWRDVSTNEQQQETRP